MFKKALKLFAIGLATCMTAFVVCAGEKKEEPKKVSELLKDANVMVSDAQEAYVNGESTKAIELYRKALKEIEKIEMQNRDRVASAEFAPLRFRKALCETEIDRIILEDVSASARTVMVTDTAALSKKRADRKKAAETNQVPEVAVALNVKRADGKITSKEEVEKDIQKQIAKEKTDSKIVDISAEVEFAKDMLSMNRLKDARHSLLKVLKQDASHHEGQFLMALLMIRENKPLDATVVLDGLLQDYPKDEAALLLASGAYCSIGNYAKSMDLLDSAMKINPMRPDGCYNMAWLLLEMNPKHLEEPELYYRRSVKLGGDRDYELEKRLGIKQK